MSEPAGLPLDGIRRLTEVSRALTYARSLEEVLDLAVDCAIDLLGCDKALLMWQGEGDRLEVRAHRGLELTGDEQLGVRLQETLLSQLSRLLGPDAEERFLGVPLVVRGHVTGLLAIRRPDTGKVDERSEWLLSALADQAAIALDGAERSRSETDIESRNAESAHRERSLRTMSHDIRSPLSAIHGYVSLLLAEGMGPLNEGQARMLGRIQTVAHHLTRLILKMIDDLRMADDDAPLKVEGIVLMQVVAEAVDVVSPLAQEAGTEISIASSPPDIEARLDPDRLRQVLIQLLENAVKHCGWGCSVEVAGRATVLDGQAAVEVSVRDDGPGIPTERHDEIFEAYRSFRSGPGATGFGLGLSIARSLVRRMGGRIAVESEVDQGACFTVTLPAGDDDDVVRAKDR